jgi:hypothetical protein
MSLLSELKRRKVFRVTAGYLLSAWVLIQVVETIFPAFGLDDAAFRMLVIILAIGLVPTVVLSWAFELTRSGLVPERSVQPAASTEAATSSSIAPAPTVMRVLRRPRFAIPLVAATLLAIGTIVALWLQLAGSRAARQDLWPAPAPSRRWRRGRARGPARARARTRAGPCPGACRRRPRAGRRAPAG